MTCNECKNFLEKKFVECKCPIESCDKSLIFCSDGCRKYHDSKMKSCSRCGLVRFCEHGFPFGSVCSFYDESMQICYDPICIPCTRESNKLFSKFVCCKHESSKHEP